MSSCSSCQSATAHLQCIDCGIQICNQCIGDPLEKYYASLDPSLQDALNQYIKMDPYDLLLLTRKGNRKLNELTQTPYFWFAFAKFVFNYDLVNDWPEMQHDDLVLNILDQNCEEWRKRFVTIAIIRATQRDVSTYLYKPSRKKYAEFLYTNGKYHLMYHTGRQKRLITKPEMSFETAIIEIYDLLSDGYTWASKKKTYRATRDPTYMEQFKKYMTGEDPDIPYEETVPEYVWSQIKK